jgi:hypothetical protein
VKYLCERCDRLAEPRGFRRDGGMLVMTCARCGAETRATWVESAAAESAAEPVAAPGTAASPSAAPVSSVARVVPLHAVPPPPSDAGEDPFEVPPGRCPKCVAPRPSSGSSCHQCGLVFANFVAAESEPSPELRAAWTGLIGRWDDMGAHDRTMAAAVARGELAAVGRLYRIRLARQPRDPIATRGRDEVLRRATTTSPLLSSNTPVNTERVKRVLFVVAAMWLAGCVGGLVYWAFLRA